MRAHFFSIDWRLTIFPNQLCLQFDGVDILVLDLAAYAWLLCLVRWNPFLWQSKLNNLTSQVEPLYLDALPRASILKPLVPEFGMVSHAALPIMSIGQPQRYPKAQRDYSHNSDGG